MRGDRSGPGKILHVIPSVSPLRGGPSFVLQAMAKGLAAQGWDIHGRLPTTTVRGAWMSLWARRCNGTP